MSRALKFLKKVFNRKKATVKVVANFATKADARAHMNAIYKRTKGPNEALKNTLNNPYFAVKGGAVARMAKNK